MKPGFYITLGALAVLTTTLMTTASCGSSSSDAVHCGPGTNLSGDECLPDLADASSIDSGSTLPNNSSDSGGETDATLDANDGSLVDSGPIVHDGDPCVAQYPVGGCSGNRIFLCQRSSATDTVGSVLFDDFGDCSVLGGECVSNVYPGPTCEGGGYTACVPSTDVSRCVGTGIFEMCDTSGKQRWVAVECTVLGAGYVCSGGDAGASCGPP